MGSYNSFYVNVNVIDDAMVSLIIESGRTIEGSTPPTWDDFCFRKWSERTKWDPTALVIALSEHFPTVIFSITYEGDWGSGKVFVHNGEEINEREVYPPRPAYPTLPALKKAIVSAKKTRINKQILAEKEGAKKMLIERQKRIKELEAELELQRLSLTTLEAFWNC